MIKMGGMLPPCGTHNNQDEIAFVELYSWEVALVISNSVGCHYEPKIMNPNLNLP